MKYSIRDLLWLMFLAAVVVAWWVDRSRLSKEADFYLTHGEIAPGVWVEF
jgi:hypothetical protein